MRQTQISEGLVAVVPVTRCGTNEIHHMRVAGKVLCKSHLLLFGAISTEHLCALTDPYSVVVLLYSKAVLQPSS